MIKELTVDGRRGTVIYVNRQWKPVDADEAVMAKVRFDDGEIAFYRLSGPKTASDTNLDFIRIEGRPVRGAETAVHRAGDRHEAQIKRAAMQAFRAARLTVDSKRLREAFEAGDKDGAKRLVARVSTVLAVQAQRLLTRPLAATMSAGGSAGLSLLKTRLKAAGGPGSGNFGHVGRPGQVGGSASDSGFSSELKSRIRSNPGPFNLLIQPEWEAILTGLGHNAEDIAAAKRMLQEYGIESSNADDIAKHIEDESDVGRVLLASAAIEEAAYHEWRDGTRERAQRTLNAAQKDWQGGWLEPFKSETGGAYDSFDEYADAELWEERRTLEKTPDLMIYRRGDVDRKVQSWTTSAEGANTSPLSGNIRIAPDKATTLEAALRGGARILGGVNRMMGASGENEITLYVPRKLAFRAAAKKRKPTKPYIVFDYTFRDDDPNAQAWVEEHAAELAKGLAETTRTEIAEAIDEAFDEVHDLRRMERRIAAAVGDETRGTLIARTEAMIATHEGQRQGWEQAVEAGILPEDAVVEWMVVGDDKVCPICSGLEGATRKLSGKYPDPGGFGPPLHPRCLPGHCFVLPGSEIAGASKRLFDGNLIVIRVSADRELACTPNHPILTPRGWIAASLLNIGDDVICDGRRQWRDGIAHRNNQQMPTAIEDVADAIFQTSQGRALYPVPTSAEDFHGDGAGSKIAVIGTNCFLRNGHDTASIQPLFHQNFIAGHLGESFDGHRTQLQVAVTRFPSRSCVCSSHLIDAGVIVHLRPFNRFAFGLVSEFDTKLAKSARDKRPTDVELACQLIDGQTVEIFTSKVSYIKRLSFRGHVFNLDTVAGWYSAGGILTQNCRCTEGISG